MTKTEAIEKIKMYFADNLDVFADCIEELDDYNGWLNDDRLYPMSELDDLLYGRNPSEIIDLVDRNTAAFNLRDDYFYFDVYGLRSTDDREEHYEDYLDDYAIQKMDDVRRYIDTIDRTPELSDLFDELEEATDEEEA